MLLLIRRCVSSSKKFRWRLDGFRFRSIRAARPEHCPSRPLQCSSVVRQRLVTTVVTDQQHSSTWCLHCTHTHTHIYSGCVCQSGCVYGGEGDNIFPTFALCLARSSAAPVEASLRPEQCCRGKLHGH